MEEIAEAEELEAEAAARRRKPGSRPVSRAGSEATIDDDTDYDNFVS
jgi:hypothetical protein